VTSTTSDQRIEVLDALRGLALGGILLANMLWLSGYLLAPAAVRSTMHAHPLDQLLLFLTRLLVHGKSYSIFSFLFGLGFALQMLGAKSHPHAGFVAQHGRRMFVLFLIGWAHAYFLWWGDILRFYALIGAFLLLFRRASERTLLTVALLALLAPVLLAVLREVGWMDLSAAVSRRSDRTLSLFVLANGDWAAFRHYNLGRIAEHAMANFGNGRALKIFGLFLLGLHCGRSGFLNRLRGDRTYLRHLLVWGGLIGIAASLLRLAETYGVMRRIESDIFDETLYLFAVYPLAAAYVALIALACMQLHLPQRRCGGGLPLVGPRARRQPAVAALLRTRPAHPDCAGDRQRLVAPPIPLRAAGVDLAHPHPAATGAAVALVAQPPRGAHFVGTTLCLGRREARVRIWPPLRVGT